MNRKVKKRYVILLALLVVCAGAVWYMTSRNSGPEGNAVLACLESGKKVCGAAGVRQIIPGLAGKAGVV